MSSLQEDTPERSRSSWLRGVRRLVVKVGTSTLTGGTQTLDEPRVARLVDQIAEVRGRGIEVLLVTSGAIGVGVGRLRIARRPTAIGQLQGAAAVGQSLLMHSYAVQFERHGLSVGQLLLTASDLSDRRRYVNITNALRALAEYGVVPIINENDTVAVDEIRVGDNDTLSAHVANAVEADALILLTDTEGVFTADPHADAHASRISVLSHGSPEMVALTAAPCAHATGRGLGTGSLRTKLEAAEIVTSSGMPMVLAQGARPDVLREVLDGEDVGTLFTPSSSRVAGRKRWIAHALKPKGTLVVDAGAYEAVVRHGKSLLPPGIVEVRGSFSLGDSIRCVDQSGAEFARGLVNYGSSEIERIRGRRTDAIEGILGYRYADEVVHRDNLVLVGDRTARSPE